MKTKVEALKDNNVKLTVTIDAKEVDERIKKTYKDFSYKYSFPGFRRGKAPRPIIDNALGSEAVCATVTDDVMNEVYPLAIDENNLYPVSRPQFEDQDALVQNGKPFEFVVTLEVKPEFELTSYEPVEIELPGEEATQEEIDQQIDALREYYFTLEDASDSAKISEDSYVELDMSATNEKGEDLPSLTSESRLHGLGVGLFPPSFDKELIGLKKGQKKSFEIVLEGDDAEMLASSAGDSEVVHFEVEVKAVQKKILPEMTDEWAQQTGFTDIKDLNERVAESITQQKSEALGNMKENQCLSVLAERLEGEVPAAMVEQTEADLLKRFFQQLQFQSISMDAYLSQQGITADVFKEDVKKQAEEMTKQDLALDAWARHKNMEVTGKEITEEFVKSGIEDPKALEAEWRATGQLHMLREGILRTRATKEILDSALVTEPKPAKKDSKASKSADADTDKKSTKKTSKKASSTKESEDKTEAKASTAKKAEAKSEAKEETETKKPAAKKPAAKKAPAKKAAE